MRRLGRRLLGPVLVLVVVAGACGDDGGGEALTAEEFTRQFDGICIGVSEQLDELSGEDLAADAARAADLTNEGLEDLEALVPPEDQADAVAAVLDGLTEIRDGFRALADAAGDPEAEADAGIVLEAAIEDAAATVQEAGLDCGFGAPTGADGLDPATLPSATDPAAEIPEYGEDPDLDERAEACAAGDLEACDALYLQSGLGSGYEAYGETCGGRNEPSGPCVAFYAG